MSTVRGGHDGRVGGAERRARAPAARPRRRPGRLPPRGRRAPPSRHGEVRRTPGCRPAGRRSTPGRARSRTLSSLPSSESTASSGRCWPSRVISSSWAARSPASFRAAPLEALRADAPADDDQRSRPARRRARGRLERGCRRVHRPRKSRPNPKAVADRDPGHRLEHVTSFDADPVGSAHQESRDPALTSGSTGLDVAAHHAYTKLSDPMTDPSRGNGRIVVVDDQLMFAQVVASWRWRRHGFDASSADLSPGTSSSRTLVWPRIEDDPPDVLLVDLDLGEFGDGNALIGPAVRAGAEVIVVTGSSRADDQERALESGARSVPLEEPVPRRPRERGSTAPAGARARACPRPSDRASRSGVELLLGPLEAQRHERLDGVRGPVDLERQRLALRTSSSWTAGSPRGPGAPGAGPMPTRTR